MVSIVPTSYQVQKFHEFQSLGLVPKFQAGTKLQSSISEIPDWYQDPKWQSFKFGEKLLLITCCCWEYICLVL